MESSELKDTIKHIVDNDLEKLSLEELMLLKRMVLFTELQDNKDNDEVKTM